jgi:transcriptional regulator with XRE-family HTH domain
MGAPTGRRRRTSADDKADVYRQLCAARLRAARGAAGLTPSALAFRCGFADSSIVHRYEEGVMPSLVRQFRLAEVLDVNPNDLWGFAPCPAPDLRGGMSP